MHPLAQSSQSLGTRVCDSSSRRRPLAQVSQLLGRSSVCDSSPRSASAQSKRSRGRHSHSSSSRRRRLPAQGQLSQGRRARGSSLWRMALHAVAPPRQLSRSTRPLLRLLRRLPTMLQSAGAVALVQLWLLPMPMQTPMQTPTLTSMQMQGRSSTPVPSVSGSATKPTTRIPCHSRI